MQHINAIKPHILGCIWKIMYKLMKQFTMCVSLCNQTYICKMSDTLQI